MTTEQTAYVKKRVISFGWNMLSVAVVSLGVLIADPEFATAVGLNGLLLVVVKEVLAQITKSLNK